MGWEEPKRGRRGARFRWTIEIGGRRPRAGKLRGRTFAERKATMRCTRAEDLDPSGERKRNARGGRGPGRDRCAAS